MKAEEFTASIQKYYGNYQNGIISTIIWKYIRDNFKEDEIEALFWIVVINYVKTYNNSCPDLNMILKLWNENKDDIIRVPNKPIRYIKAPESKKALEISHEV